MEVYLADLRQYPADVAIKALEQWGERSEWWPTWHELLGVIGEVQGYQRPALPPPAPEHRPFHEPDRRPLHEPFVSKAQWDDFMAHLRLVRDPSVPMVAREYLLRMGETIERRQRPHAEARGWA